MLDGGSALSDLGQANLGDPERLRSYRLRFALECVTIFQIQ